MNWEAIGGRGDIDVGSPLGGDPQGHHSGGVQLWGGKLRAAWGRSRPWRLEAGLIPVLFATFGAGQSRQRSDVSVRPVVKGRDSGLAEQDEMTCISVFGVMQK